MVVYGHAFHSKKGYALLMRTIGSAGLQTYRTIVLTNAAAAATTAPAMLPNSKHKQS